MFCTRCGKEIAEGYKFCSGCGAPVAPVAPVVEEPVAPVVETPVAPVVEAPVVEAPVAPVAEAPAVAAPAKKKKKGLIIALCIAIPLLILGSLAVFGWITWNNWGATYEEAMALVEEGRHEEALVLLEQIPLYEDAEEKALALQEQLDDYHGAIAKLENRDFAGAEKAFKKLGGFKESKEYLTHIIPYEKARYIMQCADEDNADGLAVAEELADITTEDPAMVPVMMYEAAAFRFAVLGEYSDARQMKNECYYRAGMLCLEVGDYEGVERYIDMTDVDAREPLLQAYVGDCADSAFLEDLTDSLKKRQELAEDESSTYADEVEAEREYLDQYVGQKFYDSRLEELFYAYMAGLDNQEHAIHEQDFVIWYTGAAERLEAVDALREEYGLLENEPELAEKLSGLAELNRAYAALEEQLGEQLLVAPKYDEDTGRYYLNFYNDTDYDFALEISQEFYNGDTFLYGTENARYEITKGERVWLWVEFPADDVAWDNWFINWYYEDIMKDGDLLT